MFAGFLPCVAIWGIQRDNIGAEPLPVHFIPLNLLKRQISERIHGRLARSRIKFVEFHFIGLNRPPANGRCDVLAR